MTKVRNNNKGIVLLIVLATIFSVILLANIILRMIVSQSRLTHHQLSRIQAYYASWAGLNYALEQLRTGAWRAGTNCPANQPCLLSSIDPQFQAAFPRSVQQVRIVLRQTSDPACQNPPDGVNACVSSTATYTYTP